MAYNFQKLVDSRDFSGDNISMKVNLPLVSPLASFRKSLIRKRRNADGSLEV